MPYDKETRDALQAYYETHDFTGNIPAFDDKKYMPAQLTKKRALCRALFFRFWCGLKDLNLHNLAPKEPDAMTPR